MNDINIPFIEAGYDDVKPTVYRADEIEFGWVSIILSLDGKTVIYNKTAILNQSEENTPSTRNACGAFSQSKINNELNYIEWTYPTVYCNPVVFWVETIKNYWGNVDNGSWLQGNANNAKDNWWLSWYYLTKTIQEMKDAIGRWYIIATWSKYVDWLKTIKSKDSFLVFVSDGWVADFWHLFCIVWYDDSKQAFIIANSWWDKILHNGLCYVKYTDISKLYSRLACVDKSNTEVVDQIKIDREMLANAQALGYWNGLNPEATSKRYESVLMALRFKYPKMDYNIILTKSVIDWIWNGKRKDDNITRWEAINIVMRWVCGMFGVDQTLYVQARNMWLWNGKNPELPATRAQVMLMVMRAIEFGRK